MKGLLLLNKPAGITSFGAVACVRRLTGEKRIGHTGTLDPMATGVLPVLLGRATALAGLVLDADKRYSAVIRLGITTDTEDITGKVLEERPVQVTDAAVREAVAGFTGHLKQRPPMVSALKKDGVRLYALARDGQTVELPEREITVFSAEITEGLNPEKEFRVDFHVSKGTYIRSLARDIGETLGCGACLAELQRTQTAGFSLRDCVSLEELSRDSVSTHLISEENAVRHLRVVSVTSKQGRRFCHGGQLDFDRLPISAPGNGELFRVKWEDRFLGIGRADLENSRLAIQCVTDDGEGIQ